MTFRKFLRMYNKFVLPTVILVICIIAVFSGIVPAVRSIQNQYIEQDALNKEIAVIRKKVQTLEALDENTLRRQVIDLMTAVPPSKQLPSVFSTLDSVALQSGVTVDSMSMGSSGNIASDSSSAASSLSRSTSGLLDIEMSVNGTSDQAKQFLDTLADVRRFVRVNSFSAGYGEDGLVKMGLLLDAFYAPYPKTLGKSGDLLEPFTANEEVLLSQVARMPLISQELAQYESLPPVEYGNKADPFSY